MSSRKECRSKSIPVAPRTVHIDPRIVYEEAIGKNLAEEKERNAKLKKEVERLQKEVYRLEGVVRQAQSDREHWRKDALEKDARLDAVMSCIRRFAEAEEEERKSSEASMRAFNRKTVAFRELLDCQIP